MSVEENKATMKRAFEEKSIDALREMHTPDYGHHWHGGVKSFDDLRHGTPGRQIILDDMIAERDRVAVWFTSKREGRDDRRACFIFRLSGGKIAESWNINRDHHSWP